MLNSTIFSNWKSFEVDSGGGAGAAKAGGVLHGPLDLNDLKKSCSLRETSLTFQNQQYASQVTQDSSTSTSSMCLRDSNQQLPLRSRTFTATSSRHEQFSQLFRGVENWKMQEMTNSAELEETLAKLHQSEEKCKAQQASILQLQQLTETLSLKFEEEYKARDESMRSVLHTRDMCMKLKDSINKIESQILKSEDDRNILVKKDKEKMTALNDIFEKVTAFESSKKDTERILQNERREFKESMESLENDFKEKCVLVEAEKTTVKILEDKYNATLKLNDKMEGLLMAQTREKDKMLAEIMQLKRNLSSESSNLKSCRTECEQMKDELQKSQREMKAQKERLDAKFHDLVKEHKNANANLKSELKKSKDFEMTISCLNEKQKQMETELQSQVVSLKEAIRDLESEKMDQTKKMTSLAEDIENVNNKVRTKDGQLQLLKSVLMNKDKIQKIMAIVIYNVLQRNACFERKLRIESDEKRKISVEEKEKIQTLRAEFLQKIAEKTECVSELEVQNEELNDNLQSKSTELERKQLIIEKQTGVIASRTKEAEENARTIEELKLAKNDLETGYKKKVSETCDVMERYRVASEQTEREKNHEIERLLATIESLRAQLVAKPCSPPMSNAKSKSLREAFPVDEIPTIADKEPLKVAKKKVPTKRVAKESCKESNLGSKPAVMKTKSKLLSSTTTAKANKGSRPRGRPKGKKTTTSAQSSEANRKPGDIWFPNDDIFAFNDDE
eukprot:Nk52_evm33s208 gene=Nk52_evmTU33s208